MSSSWFCSLPGAAFSATNVASVPAPGARRTPRAATNSWRGNTLVHASRATEGIQVPWYSFKIGVACAGQWFAGVPALENSCTKHCCWSVRTPCVELPIIATVSALVRDFEVDLGKPVICPNRSRLSEGDAWKPAASRLAAFAAFAFAAAFCSSSALFEQAHYGPQNEGRIYFTETVRAA